jgi:N-acetylneuraminate synthase
MKEKCYSQIRDIVLKYSNNNIIIIGKGASIDSIDLHMIKDALIINLNDSEKLLRGDICIFHKHWVLKSLSETGLGCKIYLTDVEEITKYKVKYLLLEFIPYTQETKELIIYRYINDDIKLEEILFITALKLCKLIADIKDEKQIVYMLGFDFNLNIGIYSQNIIVDFSHDDNTFKESFIKIQEFYLLEILELISNRKIKNIEIVHVGDKPYSKLSCHQFNQLNRHTNISKPSGVQVHIKKDFDNKEKPSKNKNNVLVVSEFTNNHLGNIDRLLEMVNLAKESGADLIKVQKRNVNKFYTKEQLDSYYKSPFGNTLGDYRHGVELTREALIALDEECKKIDIDWFSTVLDYDSYIFLKEFNRGLIKIPSTISEHTKFIEMISNDYKGPIVVSTGYTLSDYEDVILRLFKNNERIYLLHTTSAYPTPYYDCNLSVLRHYRDISKEHTNVLPGYSSHDMGSLGSMLAVAAGARMIEKHVKLGVTEWIHFDNVALDLKNGEFKNFIKDIRLAEEMCGEEIKKICKSEDHKYWPIK